MPNEKSNILTHSEHCSKFESCSATFCPLDSQRAIRAMHRDDPKCFFLLEVGKSGSKERISMCHSEAMYQVASKVFQEVVDMAYPIKNGLLRTRNTASRIRLVAQSEQQLEVA